MRGGMMNNCDDCRALDETRTALRVSEAAREQHEDTIFKLREQNKQLIAVKGGVFGLSVQDIADKYKVRHSTPYQWSFRFPDWPKPIPGFLPHRYDETDVELFMERHKGLGGK
jgi:hypothetical protein